MAVGNIAGLNSYKVQKEILPDVIPHPFLLMLIEKTSWLASLLLQLECHKHTRKQDKN